MMRRVWVPGHPRTKGSVTVQRGGRVVNAVREEEAWAALVADAVRGRMRGDAPAAGHAFVRLDFWVPFPDPAHRHAGDLDKLVRSVFDAMTKGGAWIDDRQAVLLVATERAALPWLGPGVLIAWMPTTLDDLSAQESAQVRDGFLD